MSYLRPLPWRASQSWEAERDEECRQHGGVWPQSPDWDLNERFERPPCEKCGALHGPGWSCLPYKVYSTIRGPRDEEC